MGLKPDHWIRKMAHEHRMIEPFEDKQVRNGVVSYGVSSYGYDVRVADEFKIFYQRLFRHRRPEELRHQIHGGLHRRRMCHPAQLVCAGAHR